MYVVYVGVVNHFRCDNMAEAIGMLEYYGYQTGKIYKVKEGGRLELVYEYRRW